MHSRKQRLDLLPRAIFVQRQRLDRVLQVKQPLIVVPHQLQAA